MLKLIKIAVTGSTSTGKTSVCKILEKELNAKVIYTDEITKKLLKKKAVKQKIKKIFGKEVLEKNKLNKQKLAKIVFRDIRKLKKLENILHPKIFKEIKFLYSNNIKQFFVVEIPLLFETKKEKFFDYIILIKAKKSICKKRFFNKKYFEKRVKRQIPTSDKIKKSDFIIENSSSLKNLKKQVQQVVKKIRRLNFYEKTSDN